MPRLSPRRSCFSRTEWDGVKWPVSGTQVAILSAVSEEGESLMKRIAFIQDPPSKQGARNNETSVIAGRTWLIDAGDPAAAPAWQRPEQGCDRA